jgi:hypothetical protein
MFGARWHAPMSRALGVNRSTLWRWLTGASAVPADIDARLLSIATAAAAEAAAGAAKLSAEIQEK